MMSAWVAIAVFLPTLPVLAADLDHEAPATRPVLQFVYQQNLFGHVPFEHPIPLNANHISTTVKRSGGDFDSQRWQVRGPNDFLEALRSEYYLPGRNHPHTNIVAGPSGSGMLANSYAPPRRSLGASWTF